MIRPDCLCSADPATSRELDRSVALVKMISFGVPSTYVLSDFGRAFVVSVAAGEQCSLDVGLRGIAGTVPDVRMHADLRNGSKRRERGRRGSCYDPSSMH
ncbi:hypothetical protein ACVWZ6_002288 [Bradyrhizobium sp. GM6.1]